MRRRSSGLPGGSSAGWPQCEQKRIGLGRSPPVGTNDRSIRIRAVTPGDQNTEIREVGKAQLECTGSVLNLVRRPNGALQARSRGGASEPAATEA
jgi:hypothetical protein